VIGRDEEQCRIDRFITIQIRVCLLRCTCPIPAVCLRSRKVGLNSLDLSESAVTPVYDLGKRLISGIIANDR
jgi:hypothetical protein